MANSYEKRLMRVIEAVHADPANDHSLDRLADIAALSRFHFSRIYGAIMGESVTSMVRRVRLYRASVQLVFGRAPLSKIAADHGYASTAAFSRAFAQAYGCPPSAFRKQGNLQPFHLTEQRKVTMIYPVEIRNHPARRLAAIAHKGSYMHIGQAFEKLGAVIGARGLFPKMGSMAASYYDNPDVTPAADLRSHAGFECAEDVTLTAPLEEVRLPAGDHAVLTYRGPYSGLATAYAHLFGDWLMQSGRLPGDSPVFEVYLNSPKDTAPEQLITEIWLRLV